MMKELVGTHDLVWLVLDSLRFDVAEQEMVAGRTPEFAALFPNGWEKRHSPASFTFPAHQAFFAGFLPTPADPSASMERLFAVPFGGSKSIGPGTCVVNGADVVHGLEESGYQTICVGGVGFFNGKTPLSRVLPGYFNEWHWSREMGVTGPSSTKHQFELAARRLAEISTDQRVFLFINVSAIHRPNRYYIKGRKTDDLETHAAALRYVDGCLPTLIEALAARGPSHLLACSDHGTLFGEDGYEGHRVAHPGVYTVPFGETLIRHTK
jgi:hypothetical protein